jgi:hypothetical protein
MRWAAIVLAVVLVGGLSGCAAAQEAADKVNAANDAVSKAGVCVDALRIAGFTPDIKSPEQALKDTRKKAEELGALANQAPDAAVKTAIDDLSKSMSSVKLDDLKPSSAADWLQEKANLVNKLSSACI